MLKDIDKLDTFLKIILYSMFLVAFITGINILLGGASSVPGATGGVEISIDNELRFLSVFWIAYGSFCLITAKNLERFRSFIPFIAATFFLGGIARLFSTLLIGMPSSILFSAMILELILPLFIYALNRQNRRLSLIQ